MMSVLAGFWQNVLAYLARLRRYRRAHLQDETLCNRVLKRGAKSLTDAELLGLLLSQHSSDNSAPRRGQKLLQHFGNFRSLFCTSADEFVRYRGLSNLNKARMLVLPELSRRQLLEDARQGPVLSNFSVVRRYVRLCLRDCKREVFMCIFLDTHNQIIGTEKLFIGSLSGAHVYPREVVSACLRHHATSVILVHNHPSGKAEPSPSDERVTRRLKSALSSVDITVLDHLVVGGNDVVSFSQRGLI